ncbi:ABC transporter permease [Caulobacter sp. NIBR2454]|uniref:ABC transporter permease n=1 Tax=Caulobacter sp. NIBR2454 TaxID=3015996 RepID=UPI0022B61313|nr:ABC transporter permease [Caulobacter sp. NIBR2454]
MNNLKELYRALGAWDVWWAIALDDVLSRYRRTALGPLWVVLAQAAFVAGLYLLHRSLFAGGGDQWRYLLYLSASMPVWSLLSSLMLDGSTALLRAKGFIESYPLPMPIYIVRSIVASFVLFLHMLLVYVVVFLIVRPALEPTMLLAIPGLLIVMLFGLGITLLLAPLSARYRDLSPALTAGMNLMFVLSPVFWTPTPEQKAQWLLQINPFYHLLEVVRTPLAGGTIEPHNWIAAVAIAVVSLIAGVMVFGRTRSTISYWI